MSKRLSEYYLLNINSVRVHITFNKLTTVKNFKRCLFNYQELHGIIIFINPQKIKRSKPKSLHTHLNRINIISS